MEPAETDPIPEHESETDIYDVLGIETFDEISPYIKCFIYGDPGAGKTLFGASAPNPLILDTENSRRSILDFPDLAKKAKIKRIKNHNELNEVFWHLLNGNVPDVETIVLDTISEGQRKNLDDILMSAHAKDPNRSPFLPFQGDYKLSGESMRRMVTMFRDLPYHLIILGHRIEVKDESTGRVYVRPELTPKLAQTLKGVFDIQGFLTYEYDEEGNFTNTLQTRQSRNVEAKSRFRYLAPMVDNPTFQDIIDAHKKSVDEYEKAKQQEDPAPTAQQPETPSAMFTLKAESAEGAN